METAGQYFSRTLGSSDLCAGFGVTLVVFVSAKLARRAVDLYRLRSDLYVRLFALYKGILCEIVYYFR